MQCGRKGNELNTKVAQRYKDEVIPQKTGR